MCARVCVCVCGGGSGGGPLVVVMQGKAAAVMERLLDASTC